MYAYENSENGILVQYLRKFLLQHKGLVEIFTQLQEGKFRAELKTTQAYKMVLSPIQICPSHPVIVGFAPEIIISTFL